MNVATNLDLIPLYFAQDYLTLESNMERPQWDPYDVIVQLDIKCKMQGDQIMELLASQQLQAQTISNLLKSVKNLQEGQMHLNDLVFQTMNKK